jgi:hypothetical protein
MSVGFLMIGVPVGVSTIVALWVHNPVLAVLCAPLVASIFTAVVAILTSVPSRRRPDGPTGLPLLPRPSR